MGSLASGGQGGCDVGDPGGVRLSHSVPPWWPSFSTFPCLLCPTWPPSPVLLLPPLLLGQGRGGGGCSILASPSFLPSASSCSPRLGRGYEIH